MLRRTCLFLAALLLLPACAFAQDKSTNWKLVTIPSATFEQNLLILKIEADDKASLVAVPARSTLAIKDFASRDGKVTINLTAGTTFTGKLASDGKSVVGSYGNEQFAQRARLVPTDKTEFAQNEMSTRLTAPEAYTKAMAANSRPMSLRLQAQRETDAEKKKALLDQVPAAQKEADEKVGPMMREVVAKHAKELAGAEAANFLLMNAAKCNVTAAEAAEFFAIVEAQAKPYGPAYLRTVVMNATNNLAKSKGLEAAALQVIEPYFKANQAQIDKSGANLRQMLYTSYKAALIANNKTDKTKELDVVLNKIDADLDKEYLATVPPFKPAKYEGRKEEANQVAVMELFTGAQCPPCVAADVAFDALEKAYPHKDLVLIQYHMHIPGPDPLTNPSSIARWDYYRKHFATDIRGTPSTLFNGKPSAGGGGAMANAQKKYNDYTALINPILEKNTPVKVSGTASRSGDQIKIGVEVYGAEPADGLKLRLILVEENIKYVGSNRLRFHHQVVRAMPGGPEGVDVKSKTFKHDLTADVSKIRGELNKYLDDYAAKTPFPYPQRPLDLKHLKVIALVQNDKTAEILQAVQLDVENKVAAR
jgi:hypothetical protein